VLSPGCYFVAVTSFSNFSGDDIDTWPGPGGTFGQYCLEVRIGAGFDAVYAAVRGTARRLIDRGHGPRHREGRPASGWSPAAPGRPRGGRATSTW